MNSTTHERLVLVDVDPTVSASFDTFDTHRVRTEGEIVDAFRNMPRGTRWLAPTIEAVVAPLAHAGADTGTPQEVLVLHESTASESRRRLLDALFSRVILAEAPVSPKSSSADGPRSFLAPDEMAEVLVSDTPGDYVIGGLIDPVDDAVVLYRGSFDTVILPFSFFRPATTKLMPDFSQFAIIDGGQALRFGTYEATVDIVLYDRDPEFRRRHKAQAMEQDVSFGGSLRRLRLMRGLSQGDLAPLTERQVRRIEQNEVTKIHPSTRDCLARRLNVAFDDIASF
jgi:hypothetical protein